MSKSLMRMERDPRVKSAWSEGEDGYWIELRAGWNWDDCHYLHEYTIAALRRVLRTVKPCACAHCAEAKKISEK